MDNWIFPLPRFTIFGHHFNLFQAGSLTVNRTRFFGLSLSGPKVFFIFGAAAFALVAMVVVWIRRSTFGQRLIAMKDSPAACATLGLNLTFTKLAVFTLSAAMAGLGGALYGGAIRAADASLLDFFAGLTILMVMVIGGINSIGSALFAGIFLGTPILSNLFPNLKELPLVLAGGAGIGLGKNPNGFIANDLRPKWDVFLEEPLGVVGPHRPARGGLGDPDRPRHEQLDLRHHQPRHPRPRSRGDGGGSRQAAVQGGAGPGRMAPSRRRGRDRAGQR